MESNPTQAKAGAVNWSERLTSPLALSAWLALAVLALYWPATGFEFSHYDDLTYYVENDQVQAGLGLSGVVWAFCTGTASNWHPLTWLSLMLDVDLGSGPKDAWTPHFTNILLHAMDSVLLFWVVMKCGMRGSEQGLAAGGPPALSGAKWRSWFVAALFAVHPLNVESVAWVAERKNVLSMFFFLLCLLAYVRFAEEVEVEGPKPGPTCAGRYKFFWFSVGAFALALMSKPMVVTLPFVLLLLDWWPLKRLTIYNLRFTNFRRLVGEKWPFFLLSILACVVTYLVQLHGNAVQSAEHFPLAGRVENAFVSYARYLGKAFWPVHLAVYYPHPGHWPVAAWGLAAAVVFAISAGVVLCGRRFPYLPTGWFWFLGTLVPVIGLVQAGTQAMADRYAYLPLIGIFIAIVWGGFDLMDRIKLPRATFYLAGGIVLLANAVAARHQLSFWQNDGTLFGHALAVTQRNALAEVTYGVYLEKIGQPAEAAKHYRAALAIDPNEKNAHFNLGNILDDEGKTEEAIQEYRAAFKADPAYYPAAYNLALVLERLGRRDEAIAEYKAVLQLKPDFAAAQQHLQGLGVNN